MGTESFVGWQFGMTLIAVLLIGLYLFMRVRRSQKKHGEHAGEATVSPERVGDRASVPPRQQP